jgi:hypothetical protein
MLEQLLFDHHSLAPQLLNRCLQIHRIPQYNRSRYQCQSTGSILLIFIGVKALRI